VKQFVVSPNAADDLDNIWLYLEEKTSEAVAERTLGKARKWICRAD
jgi:plasmid stabilization system protein ParE